MDQWNRIQCPERNLHIYGKLIFDKEAKTIQWEKNTLQMVQEKLETHMQEKKNSDSPLLHTIYKT